MMRFLGIVAVLAATLLIAACGQADADNGGAGSGSTAARTEAGTGGGANPGAGSGAAQEGNIVSVRVSPATTTELQSWLYAQGTARALQREFLSFTNAGRVVYVNPDLRVGSPVREGQVIAYQEPDRVRAELATARAALAGSRADLAAARAAHNEAQANLELARATFERYQVLIKQNSASAQEFDQARAQLEQARAASRRAEVQIKAADAQINASKAQVAQAEVIVSESRIVAPIDGIIARLNIEQGRYFSPQAVQTGTEQGALRTVPVLIIDPSAFEIRVDLPSYAFRQISVGADVLVGADRTQAPGAGGAAAPGTSSASNAASAPGTPGTPAIAGGSVPPPEEGEQDVKGKVHAISPSLDPETRTFEVVIRTTGDNPRLQDGEFVATWIAREEQEDVVAVPLDAFRYRNGQPFLFVVNPESGIARERAVTIGQQEGGRRTVLSGLREGEWVVTDGRARVSDGQRVRVIGEPPPAPPSHQSMPQSMPQSTPPALPGAASPAQPAADQ